MDRVRQFVDTADNYNVFDSEALKSRHEDRNETNRSGVLQVDSANACTLQGRMSDTAGWSDMFTTEASATGSVTVIAELMPEMRVVFATGTDNRAWLLDYV